MEKEIQLMTQDVINQLARYGYTDIQNKTYRELTYALSVLQTTKEYMDYHQIAQKEKVF
ncbi:hypothetical protein M3E13_15530 [Oceanobacillus kimchii]|uniref:hypothetical protein n=1 Tax=Oceanobacillus kimchii TaxID=746691 RepID=UPI0021A7A03E|nr:hypothetical protein [Oceanobacillus kimchii]MCT1575676.1 hypothetical protein [Oceanobacillus kimchii]MCT2137307.1 hypothetical protein [Oceanobacillus kimchii]